MRRSPRSTKAQTRSSGWSWRAACSRRTRFTDGRLRGGHWPVGMIDALLVLSFGGPESPDDVMPFLRNVARGRPIPPERLDEVAHHYEAFDGVSPINAANRALIEAVRQGFEAHHIDLPVYWGNRNW